MKSNNVGGEIALRDMQVCNLTETNVCNVTSQEDLNNRVRVASFIGTLQASYTDFHYLRPEWKKNAEEEALLGVSMTGIGSGEVLKYNLTEAADEVVKENRRVAELININPSARTCCIKPAGTTSLVVGSSSGIHAYHAPYYIRRMRIGKNEPLYQYMSKEIPELVEDDQFNPIGAILSFPQKSPEDCILRTEDPLTLLNRVRRFNIDFVRRGHNSGINHHNVSCTISVREDEWEGISEWMWANRNDYSGISVLPYDGGTYIQAPFEDITKNEYNELISHLHSINLYDVIEEEDITDLSGEIACGGGACEI